MLQRRGDRQHVLHHNSKNNVNSAASHIVVFELDKSPSTASMKCFALFLSEKVSYLAVNKKALASLITAEIT